MIARWGKDYNKTPTFENAQMPWNLAFNVGGSNPQPWAREFAQGQLMGQPVGITGEPLGGFMEPPQPQDLTFNDVGVSPDQYNRLQLIDKMARGGYLTPSRANSMISEIMLAQANPFEQGLNQYLAGMGQSGMGGGYGGSMFGGGGFGQDQSVGSYGGNMYGGGGDQFAIEVPDNYL